MIFVSLLEINRLHYSRSHHGARASDDGQLRRMMSTIVELSPKQSYLHSEDLGSEREDQPTSLSPLPQGTSL